MVPIGPPLLAIYPYFGYKWPDMAKIKELVRENDYCMGNFKISGLLARMLPLGSCAKKQRVAPDVDNVLVRGAKVEMVPGYLGEGTWPF